MEIVGYLGETIGKYMEIVGKYVEIVVKHVETQGNIILREIYGNLGKYMETQATQVTIMFMEIQVKV